MKYLLTILFFASAAHATEADRYYCGSGPDAFHPTMLTITHGGAFSKSKVEVANNTPGEFTFTGSEPSVTLEQAKEDLSTYGELAAIPGAKFFLTGALKFQVLEAANEIPGTMSVR